jgi:hypothetical protein
MKTNYKIYASSKYGKELIDEAKTLEEAQYLANEYRLAYGSGFTIYIK